MALTETDVVNSCLATMGEAPLTNINIPHPMVSAALNKLRDANLLVSSMDFWFCERILDVTPDPVTGDLGEQLPCGTIQVFNYNDIPLRLQDNALWDIDREELILVESRIRIRLELAFRDMPLLAQQHIRDLAVEDFQSDFDGDEAKGRKLTKKRERSYALLNAEHIRVQKVNLLNRATTGRTMLFINGFRPRLR
jgi:hypothetical protein